MFFFLILDRLTVLNTLFRFPFFKFLYALFIRQHFFHIFAHLLHVLMVERFFSHSVMLSKPTRANRKPNYWSRVNRYFSNFFPPLSFFCVSVLGVMS